MFVSLKKKIRDLSIAKQIEFSLISTILVSLILVGTLGAIWLVKKQNELVEDYQRMILSSVENAIKNDSFVGNFKFSNELYKHEIYIYKNKELIYPINEHLNRIYIDESSDVKKYYNGFQTVWGSNKNFKYNNNEYHISVEINFLRAYTRVLYLFIVLFAALLFSILIVKFINIKLQNIIIKPVEELTNAAKLISSGNFLVPINNYGKNEIGLFSSAFQDMTERLQNLFFDLEHRVLFEKLVSTLSSKFINSHNKDFGINVEHSLKILCDFLEYDSASIFLRSKNQIGYSFQNKFSWHNKNAHKLPEFIVDLDKKRNLSRLIHLETVVDSETRYFNYQNVIAFPMSLTHDLLGFLILTSKREKNNLNQDDLDLLKAIAEILFSAMERENAIQRQEFAEKALKKANDKLEKRVEERTKELLKTNQNMQTEIIAREKAQKEKEKIQDQLLHTSKLASIGSLAAGIAHEINNPMTIIIGFTQLIKEFIQKNNPNNEILDIFSKQEIAQKRITNIVNGMRIYARVDNNDAITVIDIHSEIKNTVSMLESIYNKDEITVETDLTASEFYVVGNQGRFNQVILNIISNAKDALLKCKHTKSIKIHTQNAFDSIQIKITDNGQGIAKSKINHIFDPFFTTKDPGHGTGLGLSICQSIIHAMSGNIKVHSIENEGTSFVIELPLTALNLKINESKETFYPELFKTYGTAIVIEDEEEIRKFLERNLADVGLIVDTASNGVEALEKIKNGKYDFIITDLMMPEMNGVELLKKFKFLEIKGSKVIVVTGGLLTQFSKEDQEVIKEASHLIISKPFNKEDLLKGLKSVSITKNAV